MTVAYVTEVTERCDLNTNRGRYGLKIEWNCG